MAGRGKPENLKPPWKKGQSGNPGGRPKKASITEAFLAVLEKPVPNDPQKRNYAELIAEATARQAIKGNVQAVKEIADRTEGRARQSIEIELTPITKAFDQMNAEEVEAYAKDGTLPAWFEQAAGVSTKDGRETDGGE